MCHNLRYFHQIPDKNSLSISDNENQEKKNEEILSQDKNNIDSNNIIDNDNILLDNNSLINDSGSFGNYQASNILENLSKELKDKDCLPNKNKRKKSVNNKDNDKKNDESSSSKNRVKKKYKLNSYNNGENGSDNNDSNEEVSSLKLGDSDLIKKLKIIEENEGKNISNKNINKNININSTDKFKNENDDNAKINISNLYMLNFREGTANGDKEPFTIMDTKGIFFEFFKKRK